MSIIMDPNSLGNITVDMNSKTIKISNGPVTVIQVYDYMKHIWESEELMKERRQKLDKIINNIK